MKAAEWRSRLEDTWRRMAKAAYAHAREVTDPQFALEDEPELLELAQRLERALVDVTVVDRALRGMLEERACRQADGREGAA